MEVTAIATATLSPSSLLFTLRSTRSHLHFRKSLSFTTTPPPFTRCLSAAVPRLPKPTVRCLPSSFSSDGGSGGGGIGSGGGGGGGDGSESGHPQGGAVSGDDGDVSALSSDVIILDVGGMTCGGCAASVKRILESQPQVSAASVNLATETAVVWPVSEAKVVPNWQKEVGEVLAKQLTNCGFQSNLRGQGDKEGDVEL